MCVSNVNANIYLFKKMENTDDGLIIPIKSLSKRRDSIGNLSIGEFFVAINFNLIESNKESKNRIYNVINNKGRLDCLVRIININEGEETISLKLDDFSLDFSNDSLVIDSCNGVKFCNYTREIPVINIELPKNVSNTFIIQLAVKRFINNDEIIDDKPVIQSIYKFKII